MFKNKETGSLSSDESAPTITNFVEAMEEQLTSPKERIKKNSGKIHIFVHPYYLASDSIHTDIGWSDRSKLLEMRNGLEEMLTEQTEEDTPIFIFEDKAKLDILGDIIRKFTKVETFVIGTQPDDPAPETVTWDELNKKLEKTGVRNVVISGMNLVVYWPDDSDPRLGGCIPAAADEFSKRFAIEISDLVYPNSKEEYGKYNGPTGLGSHK
jgi:hypothetical protein